MERGVAQLANRHLGEVVPLNLRAGRCVGAAFHPDNSLFAMASQYGWVRIWATNSFQEFREVGDFTGLGAAHSVSFNQDGSRLMIGGGWSEAARIWDVRGKRELLSVEGLGTIFSKIHFSKSGDILGGRSRDGELNIWRAPSWEEIEAAEPEAGRRTGSKKAGGS